MSVVNTQQRMTSVGNGFHNNRIEETILLAELTQFSSHFCCYPEHSGANDPDGRNVGTL